MSLQKWHFIINKMLQEVYTLLTGAGVGGIIGFWILKGEYAYSSKEITDRINYLNALLKEKQESLKN
ncbi:unnamed protein product [Blepharisma stoltei]|uniref:Uncharacterized protein n=1 Tax=Blepharisma stoltei TaxID=1481888 RepID=A0AAU9JPP8_9CILI|nr:unnamed protein product [Blepharisma stoltei]